MTAVAFKQACHSFAQAAAPYLPIRDDAHYAEALALIESLLEKADRSGHAVVTYGTTLARHRRPPRDRLEIHGLPGAVRQARPEQKPYHGLVPAV